MDRKKKNSAVTTKPMRMRTAMTTMMMAVVISLVLPTPTHTFTQLESCIAQTCTNDPESNCDEAWQTAIGDVESVQSSIEAKSSRLFSLSGNSKDARPFLEQSFSIEEELGSLEARSSSTLEILPVEGLQQSTMTAAQSIEEIMDITNVRNSLATSIAASLSTTTTDLNNLEQLLNETEVKSGSARAFLCPSNVPHADAFHFSGAISTSSSYGTFVMETGMYQSDVLITFEAQQGNDNTGGILLRHGSADGSQGLGLILGLTSSQMYAMVQCNSASVTLTIPFVANSSVLHTASFTRSSSGAVILRVDGKVEQGNLDTCQGIPSANMHIGTPNPVQVLPNVDPQGSFVGCIRTVAVDGRLIVQKSKASSASLTHVDCRSVQSDYLIVIDVSSSIDVHSVRSLRDFIERMAEDLLTPLNLNIRIAIAQFAGANTYSTISPFSQNVEEVLANFDLNFRIETGRSFVGSALVESAAYFQMHSSEADNRVLYMITDGDYTLEDGLSTGLMMLQNLDAKIVAFGVGSSVQSSGLLDVVQGLEENYVNVGTHNNLVSVQRVFSVDSCEPKIASIALMDQFGIGDCVRLNCAQFVAHSSQLPTTETYYVADNTRIKRILLEDAGSALTRLRAISGEVSQSASLATGFHENTFLRIAEYIDSDEYASIVGNLSIQVGMYATDVSMLSTLVSSLHQTATDEVSTITLASDIASSTLKTLEESVDTLSDTNTLADDTLSKVVSLQVQASQALISANDKLAEAVSLTQTVSIADASLNTLEDTLDKSISSTMSALVEAADSVADVQLPVNVSLFSTTVSSVVSSLENKVDLSETVLEDVLLVVSQHESQGMQVQSLQTEYTANSMEYTALQAQLSSLEVGLSLSVDDERNILAPSLSLQQSLNKALSANVDVDVSREDSATVRLNMLRSSITETEASVSSTKDALDVTQGVVSDAVDCFEEASMALSSLEVVRGNVRSVVDTTDNQLSMALSSFVGISPRLSQLDLVHRSDSSIALQQSSIAMSLADRHAAQNERALSIAQLVSSISDDCLET
eukprot:m.118099 g.118099  ORF g.118099 m.118099 type:complete len:1042 (-) comp12884_c0_seq1:58-3183(-)